MRAARLATTVLCFIVGCTGHSGQDALQGKWVLQEMAGGFTFDLPPFKMDDKDTLTFHENRFTYVNNIESLKKVEGEFECDDSVSPRRIRFRFQNREVVGIYSIRGDKLELCVGKDDKTPPREFAGGPGSRPAHVKYVRDR